MSSKTWWRTIDFVSLSIEDWDGEFTVYHPESGKTHFLNQMGMQILMMLNSHPLAVASTDDISENIVKHYQLEPDSLFFSSKCIKRCIVLLSWA